MKEYEEFKMEHEEGCSSSAAKIKEYNSLH
jgi:hypothetical protein